MNDKLIQLMEDIETGLKGPVENLNFFRTDFGQEFEANYIDLMAFANIATFSIPTSLKILSVLLPDLESGEYIEQILKMSPLDMTETERKQLVQLKEFQEQFRLPPTKKDVTPELPKVQDELEAVESSLIEIMDTMQVLPRIIAYFILALHSYIDAYAMSLVQFVISVSPVEDLYQIFKGIRPDENPNERIKHILKAADEKNLSEPLWKLLEEKNWEKHQTAFANLKHLRNQIVHRNPLTTPQELQEAFPQLGEIAKYEVKQVRFMAKHWIMPDYYKKMIVKLFMEQDFETFFMIQHLAQSCYRYLALIDNLMVNWVKNYQNKT